MHFKLLILVTNYVGICNSFVMFDSMNSNKSDCCIQDEWEGNVFIDSGHVFIDQNTFMAYLNATMHVAYSISEHKFYYEMNVTELTPLLPKPQETHIINLRDYKKGVSYMVTDGDCEKDEIEKKMKKQCIPSDAKLLSEGVFTDKTRQMRTYQFVIYYQDRPIQITATILLTMLPLYNDTHWDTKIVCVVRWETLYGDLEPVEKPTCEPFFATYFTGDPGNGDVYTFNVMDVEPIVSKHLFDIPEACLHLN